MLKKVSIGAETVSAAAVTIEQSARNKTLADKESLYLTLTREFEALKKQVCEQLNLPEKR